MPTTARHPENVAIPTCGMAVMAKASVPGRTKTRLVPPLTPDEAARLNTAFLRDIADNVLAAAGELSIAGYMAFTPPQSKPFFEANLPHEIALIEACHPTLGECLAATVARLMELGHRCAILLNSDSPTLPTSLLVEAVEALAKPGDRAVLGPASDGGYYLIGLKQRHRRLFENIAWSTEHVARQTLDRATEIGLPVHLLAQWYDVDDVGALKILQAELFNDRPSASKLRPGLARHTRAFMRSLMESSDCKARIGLDDGFGRAAE